VFGWNWGGGLYVNYAFALAWLGDVVWSWVDPSAWLARPEWLAWTVRGFFLFMILNGAVIFASGAARWWGALLCLALVAGWWSRRKGAAGSPRTRPRI
jgi:hypothetical protein